MKVGNAQGFWGDQVTAAKTLCDQQPDLDYLTLDYLAEVSLSIMAIQRKEDPTLGYARDFLKVVQSLAPLWKAGRGPKLITNAGGLNPEGCARACATALRAAGCTGIKIGVVAGDNVLHLVGDAGCVNAETGERLGDAKLITANAYLGADGIVEALQQGAHIVLTGRVADPSLVVGAARYHYDWKSDAYHKLAGATVAGHLIECGTQVTGGISDQWLDIADPAGIGFPIVEIAEDGSCIVTKPAGSSGIVNGNTVKEQLLYEIGDPDRYLSPDCVVSLLKLSLEEIGPNRVRVSGAVGRAPTDSYKVSATSEEGWRSEGMLTIFGKGAVQKAQRAGEVIIERVNRAGYPLAQTHIECLGAGDVIPGVDIGIDREAVKEVVLRIAVADRNRAAVEQFTREIAPLVTSGPPGTTGYASGRPNVRPVFGYWPSLIARNLVAPTVHLIPMEVA